MSLGAIRRVIVVPAVVAAGVGVLLATSTDATSKPLAFVMFCLGAFALTALAREVIRGASAQRRLGGGSWLGALGTVVSRNRRRYGGYTVHAGVAVALIAVAASSSFQTSRALRLRPGQSAQVGNYGVHYVRPTSNINPVEQRLTFGAVLAVTHNGSHYATLTPSRDYYASTTVPPGTGPVRSFLSGEATSEVGRKTEPSGDVWTAMQPDLASVYPFINGADARLERIARAAPKNNPQAQGALSYLQGLAIRSLAARYMKDTPPSEFRVNVNPLVIWIWIGGAIAVAGALVAVWPAPEAKRRRVADVHAARLARDLGRA